MSGTWNPLRTAILAAVLFVACAFGAAYLTQSSDLLSITPPDSNTPDAVGKEFALYASAFTAWAALLLMIPAYIFVWFKTHTQSWLAFWSVSYAAYIIHLIVSAFWFFEGDFAAMSSSTRVSAFWPGMLILIWWGVDVAIGLTGAQKTWVTVQRAIIHILVLVLFVGGSAVKGETALVQLMGWALLGAGIGALTVALITRRTRA